MIYPNAAFLQSSKMSAVLQDEVGEGQRSLDLLWFSCKAASCLDLVR